MVWMLWFWFLKHTFSWETTKGDEVIVPANTYIASILAILKQI
jgi:dTDP-4-amino-4,6-dideoxygalactose transaminase